MFFFTYSTFLRNEYVKKVQNLQLQSLQGSCRANGQSLYYRTKMYPGKGDLTYLQEGHSHVILLQDVSIHGGPLQNQADDSPLIIEGIIHFLLFGTLRRLCVVSAEESRKTFYHFTVLLAKVESERVQIQTASFLDGFTPSFGASRKAPPIKKFWTECM